MIKPVDFQVLLPKTPEISRLQSNEQHKGIAMQQLQLTSLQNIAENSLKKVNLPDKAYEVKINEKQQKERHEAQKENNKDKKKRDAKSTKQKERCMGGGEDSIIDIKI